MRNIKLIILPLLFFLYLLPMFAHGDRIEVIQLQGRSAAEIIPIIQPLLDQDTGLSAQGYQLIVRGSEATLSQVHDLVKQLDHAPQQLMISLRHGGDTHQQRQGINASGTIKSGDARVSVNGGKENSVRIFQSQRSIQDDAVRRIHVTEGRQAFIQTGQLVPIGERRVDQFGRRSDSIRYKNATSGFYVVPRLAGNTVNLDVLQNNVSIDRHGRQRFNVQRTGTTLSGQIGEWFPLAGVSQQSSQSGTGILHSTRRDSQRDSQLFIKVDVISD